MKKLILVIMLLGISGCATAAGSVTTNATISFNPDRRSVYYNNGKSYHVPNNVIFLSMDRTRVDLFASAGIFSCNENDVVWVATKYVKEKIHILNRFSGKATKQWTKNGFDQHLMGCSSVMSDQELAYYSEK